MIKFEHSEVINRPVQDVFEYITNIDNWPNWSGEVIEIKKISERPIDLGTTFSTSVRVMGRQIENTIEVVAYDQDRKLSLKTTSGPVDGFLHCNFEPVEGSTKLTVSGQGELGGFYKLVEPIVNDLLQNQYKTAFATLKDLLDAQT